MNKLILLGGGGHCKVIIDAIRKAGLYNIEGIIDRTLEVGRKVQSVPVIGDDNALEGFFASGIRNAFIAVGSVGDSSNREKLYNRAVELGFNMPWIVHPDAVIAEDVHIGNGVFIAASATVNPGTKIGDNTIINTFASVDHDCSIGAHVHIAPGSILSGDVYVGDGSHVGTGAKVVNGVRIGKGCIICAGEVVTGNVPDRKKIRSEKKIFIIAEAGVNHNGSVETAKKMIDVAKDAGADAVKFQTFDAERIASRYAEKAGYQINTDGSGSQLDMLKKLEISRGSQEELKTYCNSRGIMFLSSPFDTESVDFLAGMGLDMIKIPSGEIVNLPYLRKIGALGVKVILSSGMSDMVEIRAAVEVLASSGTAKENITVLHCNTEYPTPYEDVNLMAMLTIRDELGIRVGYSDHTTGIEVAVAAAAMGAEVLEKHFTLDRNMEGPDHRASLEPYELEAMIKAVRNVEKAIGRGIKEPSRSEVGNRKAVRKSLVAAREIKKGEMFTADNITAKRPASGISPMKWDEVVGKKARRDFALDEEIEL